MRAIVLGSAAGGGFPQWNSNAPACRRARARRSDRASADAGLARGLGERSRLVHPERLSRPAASRSRRRRSLHPREGLRSSPIAGVVLTGGDVDAIAGLLASARAAPLHGLCAGTGAGDPRSEPDFRCVRRGLRRARAELPLDRQLQLAGHAGTSGLGVEAFAVPGKSAALSGRRGVRSDAARGRRRHRVWRSPRRRPARRFFFIPGCAAMTDRLRQRLTRSDAGVFRRHSVERRRDDPARGRQQDRPAHGAYEHERRGRRDRRLWRAGRRAPRSLCTSTTPIRSCSTIRPSAGRPRPPAGKSPMTAWRSGCERRGLVAGGRLEETLRRSARSATTTAIRFTT